MVVTLVSDCGGGGVCDGGRQPVMHATSKGNVGVFWKRVLVFHFISYSPLDNEKVSDRLSVACACQANVANGIRLSCFMREERIYEHKKNAAC